ncbi:MAG: prolyl oligopeptidase family serine peptidase [Pseudomonadota bacterium]
MTRAVPLIVALLLPAALFAEPVVRTVNNGNLVLEDVPEIPEAIVESLNRYQNVRSASLLDWSADGESIYINTRFGDVGQLHRVSAPGGARRQLTFFEEPIGQVARRPEAGELAFTMDAGGSEFSQIFVFDPATREHRMLTDGESRNGVVSWNRDGSLLAYQSTRRNGQANDLWVMDPADADSARLAYEATDGAWYGASDFDNAGERLLMLRYVRATESEIHLLDLDTGTARRVDGAGDTPTANYPAGFAADDTGFYFLTSQQGEFNQLAYRTLDAAATTEMLTGDIPWDIDQFALSDDRRRAAFAANEGGLSALYLLDPKTRRYQRVDGIPTGVIVSIDFSPDGRRLGLTLNTAQTPSDTYVLALGRSPLRYGELTRWTYSEVGGLDTERFVSPELIRYPTFDTVDGAPRQIPAFVYRPPGDGPHPVIVSIHGGPEGQARPFFSGTYQLWLARLGAAVVVPNVRGSAGYGKSYLQLDNGMQREDSVRDIGALLDWIERDPGLDADRVGVFGGSYGGYMVLASSVHYSDRLQAAVNIVGISNFVTFLENTQDYRRDLRRVEYGDERDPAMREFLEGISPLNNVDKIDVPMFVVQGQNDPRVPVTEAEQIVAALRDGDSPVWYMNALNEGHGYRKKENIDVYQQAVVLFFQQHLLEPARQ